MARYLLRRFALTLPAIWLVLTMVFFLIHIVPGDPVEQMLGEGAAPGAGSAIAAFAGAGSARFMCNMDDTLRMLFAAIWDNRSNFKRQCDR